MTPALMWCSRRTLFPCRREARDWRRRQYGCAAGKSRKRRREELDRRLEYAVGTARHLACGTEAICGAVPERCLTVLEEEGQIRARQAKRSR